MRKTTKMKTVLVRFQNNHTPMDTLSLTKEAKIHNGLKTNSLTSGAGKTGQRLVKNETRTLSNTIHKNKLKMD